MLHRADAAAAQTKVLVERRGKPLAVGLAGEYGIDGGFEQPVNCNMAEAIREKNKTYPACSLPGNRINHYWLTPYARTRTPGCNVSDARWIDEDAKHEGEFYELTCKDGTGAVYNIPHADKADQTVGLMSCLQTDGTPLACKLTDHAAAVKALASAAKAARGDCELSDARYIGGKGGLRVLRSRFERGTGGHYLKSRVPRVEIVGNSFDDSQGRNTNYAIDLSWGATGRVAGNSFVQGPNKDNYSTMISVAPEGRENNSSGLVIEDNRAWLAPGFEHETTFVGNWSRDQVTVRNNQLSERIKPYASR